MRDWLLTLALLACDKDGACPTRTPGEGTPVTPENSRQATTRITDAGGRFVEIDVIVPELWLGHAVYGLAFLPAGLVALAPQTILLASILKVTGIPATEAQALRSKGDAYRRYQQATSAFIPRPRRR